ERDEIVERALAAEAARETEIAALFLAPRWHRRPSIARGRGGRYLQLGSIAPPRSSVQVASLSPSERPTPTTTSIAFTRSGELAGSVDHCWNVSMPAVLPDATSSAIGMLVPQAAV